MSTALDPVDVSTDTVDDLLERVRPMAARAVDALQVAASLEADGVTDEIARSRYGCADVFVLAAEVHRTAGQAGSLESTATGPPATVSTATATTGTRTARLLGSASGLRDVSHGLLYLLPATVFPAALAVLGRRSLVFGLVLAAGVGWVWAGGATWLAYGLLGRGYPGSAARVLRWSAVSGLPVTAAASAVLVAATHAGYGLVAMALAQMTYQMAATLLMFYRREVWLFVVMVPGAVLGVAYVVVGDGLLVPALAVGAGSVAVAFGIAFWHASGRVTGPAPRLRDGLGDELGRLPLVVVYTALSAAYLLHAQGRYMLDHFDLVVAYVPLIVGMGVVEWRARRFGDVSRALLHRVRYPREFVPQVLRLLARDVGVCAAVVAVLGLALLVLLAATERFSVAAVLMTASTVLLAGAYFSGFVLANMARFAWLCGSLATCIVAHLVLAAAAPRDLGPVAGTAMFLASALLLFTLFLSALVGGVVQARTHR
jgi:hypothetical protein